MFSSFSENFEVKLLNEEKNEKKKETNKKRKKQSNIRKQNLFLFKVYETQELLLDQNDLVSFQIEGF